MNTKIPYALPEGFTPRPAIWADVPDEQWNDWRWQLSHRVSSYEELSQFIHLTPEEEAGLKAQTKFRVDITPYFASLIDSDDPECPVRQQVIPHKRELEGFEAMMRDSLGEDSHSPVPGLVHRYPDRVLMLVTTQCASYCRYCTRSRIVGDPGATFSRHQHDQQIEYIARSPQVRDVLLSGGDPLTLPPRVLEDLLRRLRAIPHVEIIRIGSRVPVFMPQRVTDELVDMLRQFHPLWLNIHVNHPKEVTPELARACAKLADAGIPLGNQSVLLAGVNDHPDTIKALCHALVKIRVRPYYLYQCDLVAGSGQFRTSISAGLEIMEALRGHTSGYAIPQYAVDLPGGGGKVPVMPNYLISISEDRAVFRNFEGYISTYVQPGDYHRPKRNKWTAASKEEKGQKGVSSLLAGEGMVIKPEGWTGTHMRGRKDEHAGTGGEASEVYSQEMISIEDIEQARDVEIAPEGDEPVWARVN
jgi:lysine 2,3-aminomutase